MHAGTTGVYVGTGGIGNGKDLPSRAKDRLGRQTVRMRIRQPTRKMGAFQSKSMRTWYNLAVPFSSLPENSFFRLLHVFCNGRAHKPFPASNIVLSAHLLAYMVENCISAFP